MKLSDLKKGLTKPKKVSKEAFEANIQEEIVAATQSGRAFVYPSGKKGEDRHWSQDEKHAIHEEALRLAEAARALATLVKKAAGVSKAEPALAGERDPRTDRRGARLTVHPSGKKGRSGAGFATRSTPSAKRDSALAAAPDALATLAKKAAAVSGADMSFAEGVIRDLIAEEKLFEHPLAKPGKPQRFASHPVPPPPPPPHPLTVGKAKAAFAAAEGCPEGADIPRRRGGGTPRPPAPNSPRRHRNRN